MVQVLIYLKDINRVPIILQKDVRQIFKVEEVNEDILELI